MVHKFCQNHLSALYEAIKEGSVSDIEKIEHELTRSEECVACAYALKAQGEAKEELLKYLASEGFGQGDFKKKTFFDHLWFWTSRLVIMLAFFGATLIILKIYTNLLPAVVIAFLVSILAFIFIDQLFGND